MRKVLIFGTGSTGRRIYDEVKMKCQVVGFLDNDSEKWGKCIDNIPIIGNANSLDNIEYDEILICSLPGLNIIREQLLEAGVEKAKISSGFIDTQVNARINFIQDFAALCDMKEDASLSVAEGGVFQGEFAKEINKYFPKQDLFLFDTFEGFDSRDIKMEEENSFSVFKENHLGITSEELVLSRLPYGEKAIIRKGYFPDTAKGLEDKKFLFVNLDFDLYNPILEGLRFFYPRLVKGGCMLVHDYYNPGYKGVKEAVDEFEKNHGRVIKFPIGDHCSIGIIKYI